MIVVVGGNARGVGKTTLICAILRAFPQGQWRALKVTPHHHLQESGDTQRFRAAGAIEAYLRSVAHLPALETGNWIIESNRILHLLTPDAYIFIQAAQPPDEKSPDRWHLDQAAIVLRGWVPSDHLPPPVRSLVQHLCEHTQPETPTS